MMSPAASDRHLSGFEKRPKMPHPTTLFALSLVHCQRRLHISRVKNISKVLEESGVSFRLAPPYGGLLVLRHFGFQMVLRTKTNYFWNISRERLVTVASFWWWLHWDTRTHFLAATCTKCDLLLLYVIVCCCYTVRVTQDHKWEIT